MEEKKLDEKLRELADAVKNFKQSKHNPSYDLEVYARELFEEIMRDC
jgi:hypothetical protein